MNLPPGHPTRGTCSDSTCPMYGLCHDGCGQATRLARQNRSEGSRYGAWVKGQPMVWIGGRHRQSEDYWTVRMESGSYVERDRLKDMIDFLANRYGTLDRAADATGIARGTLTSLRYQRTRKACYARTAKLIADAVLACKVPADPWAEFEDRRAPTEWERVKSRHYWQNERKQRERAQRAKRKEAG